MSSQDKRRCQLIRKLFSVFIMILVSLIWFSWKFYLHRTKTFKRSNDVQVNMNHKCIISCRKDLVSDMKFRNGVNNFEFLKENVLFLLCTPFHSLLCFLKSVPNLYAIVHFSVISTKVAVPLLPPFLLRSKQSDQTAHEQYQKLEMDVSVMDKIYLNPVCTGLFHTHF